MTRTRRHHLLCNRFHRQCGHRYRSWQSLTKAARRAIWEQEIADWAAISSNQPAAPSSLPSAVS